MRKPIGLWQLYFKIRVRLRKIQGYKFLDWGGRLNPVQINWIENIYGYAVDEMAQDIPYPDHLIFFGKPKSMLEAAIEYLC